MSRRGPRSSGDDLAYGDIPQRWDRDRFERFGGGGGAPRRYEEEDFRFTERDRGGRRDVNVMEREQSRGPRGRFEETVRFSEDERRAPSRRRRTDRELFGDVDPREIAGMALTRYEKPGVSWREEVDYEERERDRPRLARRQSSLDTYDRRPIPRYEREEVRVPAYQPVYTPVPVPYMAPVPYDPYQQGRYRNYEPDNYREVEIHRERSTHRSPSRRSKRRSKSKSVARESSSSSSSSSTEIEEEKSVHASSHHRGGSTAKSVRESFHESIHEGNDSKSINESFHETVRKSKAPSTHVSRRSGTSKAKSAHESFHESFHESEHNDRQSFHESISESIHETEKKFKKGKTKMPKRLVRREAIMDLGYPFDEEDNFFMLRIALEKEQIDEVMDLSKEYFNGEKQSVYKFEDNVNESSPTPSGEREHEEVIRTEWINPPTVVGDNRSNYSRARSRHESPGGRSGATRRTGRSRAASNRDEFFEERTKTVIDERTSNANNNHLAPPPPAPLPPPPPQQGGRDNEFYEEKTKTIIEERSPSHARAPSHHHGGSLVVQDRNYRSDRDIQAEIRALEAEQRALRLEREADDRQNLALRLRERPYGNDELDVVEYQERRPREYLEYERVRPPGEDATLGVSKDRKARSRSTNARLMKAAMFTLT